MEERNEAVARVNLFLANARLFPREEFHVRGSVRVDLEVAGKLLRFGSPAGFEMFLNMMAFNTLVLIFHSHTAETATAATVVSMFGLFSGLVYARYQNGKWKQLRVVQREPGWVPGGDVPDVF